MDGFQKQCEEAITLGNKELAVSLANKVVQDDIDVVDAIENGFSKGIKRAGELWENGEYFLPELAFSAEVMKAVMAVLQPALLKKAAGYSRGNIVIGTVQGDIHDIGKSLVATMLAANGFVITDLGADVAHSRFIDEVSSMDSVLLCMSALLTTTMVGQGNVIEILEHRGLRDNVKVLVGGAPASASWAKEIGADAYAENAVEAVRVAGTLLT